MTDQNSYKLNLSAHYTDKIQCDFIFSNHWLVQIQSTLLQLLSKQASFPTISITSPCWIMIFVLTIWHARSIYCVIWDQIYSQISTPGKILLQTSHKTDSACFNDLHFVTVSNVRCMGSMHGINAQSYQNVYSLKQCGAAGLNKFLWTFCQLLTPNKTLLFSQPLLHTYSACVWVPPSAFNQIYVPSP